MSNDDLWLIFQTLIKKENSHFNHIIFAYIPFKKTDLVNEQTKRNFCKESWSLRNDPALFI